MYIAKNHGRRERHMLLLPFVLSVVILLRANAACWRTRWQPAETRFARIGLQADVRLCVRRAVTAPAARLVARRTAGAKAPLLASSRTWAFTFNG